MSNNNKNTSNDNIKKLICYGIVCILIMLWASIIITTINKNRFVSAEESLEGNKQIKKLFQVMYNKMDCDKSYDYQSCISIKSSFEEFMSWLDEVIDCDTRIASQDDLEKSDISFCLDASIKLRDAVKNIYIISDWTCDSECEEDLKWYEHNISMFQTYLDKID